MGSTKKFNLEIFLIGCFALFAAIFILKVQGINPTAAMFPRMVSTVVLALTLYLIAGRIWPRKAVTDGAGEGKKKKAAAQGVAWTTSLGMMVLYFVLIFVFGFAWATICYGVALPFIMGNRNFKVIVPFAVIMMVVLVIGLSRAFYISFPSGLLLPWPLNLNFFDF